MLPRHSLLRASYHIGSAFLHAASPALRNCALQPAEPGFAGGVQYRPSDSNVAMALVLVEGSVRPPAVPPVVVPPVVGPSVGVPPVVVPPVVVPLVVPPVVVPATGVKASLSTRASAPPAPLPISLITSLFVRLTLLMVNVAAASTTGYVYERRSVAPL